MGEEARPQVEKFKELARELEADESEERFEDQVRRIAKKPSLAPPSDEAD